MFKRILIAFDSGESAARAVDAGIELARQLRAHVALLHVLPPAADYVSEGTVGIGDLLGAERRRAQHVFADIRAMLPPGITAVDYLREGEPSAEIVSLARRWGADLVVVGTHGAGRIGSFLLGSTAQAVIHKSPCPVLVVRQQVESTRAPHASTSLTEGAGD
jgi:nucleotide-binding universal stress UspA family protein